MSGRSNACYFCCHRNVRSLPSNSACLCVRVCVEVVRVILAFTSQRTSRWCGYIHGRQGAPASARAGPTLGHCYPGWSQWRCRADDVVMTASKNANVAGGGGGGGSTSATTCDGDYRLVPHEVITSPTTSYEVEQQPTCITSRANAHPNGWYMITLSCR